LSTAIDLLSFYFQKLDVDLKFENSESRFSELFENIRDIVFKADADGLIIKINPAAYRLLGTDHIEGRYLFDFIVPSERVELKKNLERIISKGETTFNFENGFLTNNGEIVHCQTDGIIRYGKEGMPIEVFAVARDITQQRRYEQNILKAIINTQEEERKRFAKDLHDGIGPLLSGIKLYLQKEALEKEMNQQQINVLKFSRELVDEAISQIRIIANNLTPVLINDFGLEKALFSYIQKINAIGELVINLEIKNPLDTVIDELAISVFRIISELVTNAIKHSNGNRVEMKIDIRKNILSIIYSDNGQGFDPKHLKLNESYKSMGINNIYNRVHSFHGSIILRSKKGQGVLMKIYIPMNNTNQKTKVAEE
jgi:PAS domain S-box-containing protein